MPHQGHVVPRHEHLSSGGTHPGGWYREWERGTRRVMLSLNNSHVAETGSMPIARSYSHVTGTYATACKATLEDLNYSD